MNYDRILQEILNIGDLLLQSGAENFRTEDSLYRMCKAYGCVKCDIHVIPSNIQATIETPQGEIYTQIRHVRRTGYDFVKLDHLNNLCRYVCSHTPDEKELKKLRLEIELEKPQSLIRYTIAAAVSGGCFTVFFGGGFIDAIIGTLISMMLLHGQDRNMSIALGPPFSLQAVPSAVLALPCCFMCRGFHFSIMASEPFSPGSFMPFAIISRV